MKQSLPEQTSYFSVEENLKRLQSGVVLLAKDVLQDPNFDSTLVLICLHSKDGAYGLVLNRPSHMPLSEMFDGFTGLDLKREIYIGGPVQQEELQIVQVTDAPIDEAFPVAPRVYMGGRWDSIGQMIETDPDTTHLFLGYSGWGPEQLESEVQAGAWDVYKVNIERILLESRNLVASEAKSFAQFLNSCRLD